MPFSRPPAAALGGRLSLLPAVFIGGIIFLATRGSFGAVFVPAVNDVVVPLPCAARHCSGSSPFDAACIRANLLSAILAACSSVGHPPLLLPCPFQIAMADRELAGYREQLKKLPPSAQGMVKSKALQVRPPRGAWSGVELHHSVSVVSSVCACVRRVAGPEAQEDV